MEGSSVPSGESRASALRCMARSCRAHFAPVRRTAVVTAIETPARRYEQATHSSKRKDGSPPLFGSDGLESRNSSAHRNVLTECGGRRRWTLR